MLAEEGVAREYHVVQHELGIGDIICSLYALNGFSVGLNRPPIVLHLQDHFEWIPLVDIPNLRIAERDEPVPPGSLQLGDDGAGYAAKLRTGCDPKQWYARKLGVKPVRPPLNEQLFARRPDIDAPYVVIAPFATRVNRTWEVHNWRLVARELESAGYKVIAVDGPHQPDRCRETGVDHFWGQSPAWTANLCRHAELVISGDSGLAHVGGLIGVPTLVILSQQLPEVWFSMTSNRFVVPAQHCTGCRFQVSRGYEEKCDFGCWALQSISPTIVSERALEMLS